MTTHANPTLRSHEPGAPSAGDQYRLLFEVNPTPMWVYDIRTLGFLAVNDAAVARYGYTRTEFARLTIRDLRPEEDGPTLRSVLEAPNVEPRVWRHRWKDGAVRLVEVSARDLEYGGRPARLIVANDVTEAARQRAVQHEREELLRTVIAHVPCGVYWKNRDAVFLGCNDTFARDRGLHGVSAVLGYTDIELGGPGSEGEQYDARDRRVMETGDELTESEEVQARTDGPHAVLMARQVPLRSTEGEVVGVLGVYRDVTELRRLKNELRHVAQVQYEHRLTGGLTADISNLLTAVHGNIELALSRLSSNDPARPMVEDASRAASKVSDLTNQLVAIGRRQNFQPTGLELNAVVRGTVRLLGRLIGEDVELVIVLAPDVPQVRTTPDHISQVLINLVANARDAMPTGGTLTIETANVVPGSYARLSVTDTGTGMTESVRRQVFEPFFTTKEPGKGAGLATTLGIVKQSGGHIEVESAVGRGSTFRVYLPSIVAPAVDQRVSDVSAPEGTEVVLLMGDTPEVQARAQLDLRKRGYTVLVAASAKGAKALVAGRERAVNLLVANVATRRAGGRELAEWLRAVHPGVKVLFTLGYTHDEGLSCKVADAPDHITHKLFPLNSLALKVREALDAPA